MPFERKKIQHATLLLAALAAFFLLTGMGTRPPLTGGPAPPFILNDLEGRPVNLADYQGKVVLLTFWATWCEPCKKEMPEIQASYEEYKDRGVMILAVNFGENQKSAKPFVDQLGLTFPVLLDKKVGVASRYGVVSLPVSFFIDTNGIIQEHVFGGTLTKKGIAEILQRLVRRPL